MKSNPSNFLKTWVRAVVPALAFGVLAACAMDGATSVGPSEESSGTRCLPNAYELAFKGFKTADYRLIEKYIVEFKGYKKHTLTSGGKRRSVYWYNSCIGSARLNRNLDSMFELMDVKSHMSFAGNKFEIRKIRVRR